MKEVGMDARFRGHDGGAGMILWGRLDGGWTETHRQD